MPLLVDPNLGLIAKVTLNDLFLHSPLSPARVRGLTARLELSDLRMVVRDALSYGLYDSAYLIYSYVAVDANQTGGLKFSYLWSDFVSSVAKGPDNRFWYTTGVGALWEVNQNGIVLASTGGIAQIATGLSETAIYCLTDWGVVYQKTPGSAWTLVSNGGITSIASGLNGQVILLLTDSGDLWNVSSSGWAFAGPGIAAIVTGLNGTGVYERASGSGAVWVYTPRGWLAVSGGGIAWMAGEKNRQGIYARTATGDLYRLDRNGVWTLLLTGISDVRLGVGGLTINVLRTDGTVWQGDLQSNGVMIDWNTGAFEWTQLWPGQTFTSIALLDGGMLLDAMQIDGQHFMTSASTF